MLNVRTAIDVQGSADVAGLDQLVRDGVTEDPDFPAGTACHVRRKLMKQRRSLSCGQGTWHFRSGVPLRYPYSNS